MAASRIDMTLSSDVLIEEETIPGYEAKHFHPTNVGDLLHNRYKVLAKLGWGASSTVWICKDTSRWFWQPDQYVTLKIAISGESDAAKHEINMSRYLETNPAHKGFRFVRTTMDAFEIEGSHGTHPCLVYKPMRETMNQFQQRLPDGKIPGPLLKLYMQHLLLGLDYLHSECGIVHTDIKQDNILMGFEDPSVLEESLQVNSQSEETVPWKIRNSRPVYLSQYDFGPLKSFRMLPKLGDFGLAQRADGPESQRHPIQPPLFQAPEVILGTGWTYSADIWNLGVLLWNLLEDQDLFRDILSDGVYDSRKHLAEMVALIGPPPRELREREERWSKVPWRCSFQNPEGRLCWTAREFYGGPFFNQQGGFLYGHLVPYDSNLSGLVSSLEGEDKNQFLDFVRQMLQWLPERRKTAKELLKHPWLGIKS